MRTLIKVVGLVLFGVGLLGLTLVNPEVGTFVALLIGGHILRTEF